ncbi:MAG: hypothetical protein ACFB4I_04345 [Cyanophyceae cyanobacterium]
MLQKLRTNQLIQHVLLVLLLEVVLMIGIALGNLWQGQAIAAPSPSQTLAYDIDQNIDQQRKEATEKHYGEDAGKVAEDALKNNEQGSNSQYKVKSEDSLLERAQKVTQQVKDRGLVDKKTQS